MHDTTPSNTTHPLSVIARLRALIPSQCTLTFQDALTIAERQAETIHTLEGIVADPVDSTVVAGLPKLHVEIVDSPVCSLHFWDETQRQWVVQLASSASEAKRRYRLAYEFKHILDYGHRHQLYRGSRTMTTNCQAEHAAAYFAGSLLVPAEPLTRAWWTGFREIKELAKWFDVPTDIISMRLADLGITQAKPVANHPTPKGVRR